MLNKYIVLILMAFSAFSALQANEPDMQTFLTEYYYSPEKNQKRYSKLLYAVGKGYRNIAFKLLEKGENPNYLPSNATLPTPFILATYHEDEELVQAMIKYGADVNLKAYMPDDFSYPLSPLCVAAKYNKSEKITKILCDFKASNFNDHLLNLIGTPLGITLNNVDISKFLIIASTLTDSQLNIIDLMYNNPLTLIGVSSSQEQKLNTLKIAHYLIERGVPLETESTSALAAAINVGNRELFDLYLSLGANINYTNKWEIAHICPLFASINYVHQQVYFLQKIHPNCKEHIASSLEFLQTLLELGADPDYSFYCGEYCITERFSPLTYAIHHRLDEVVSLLVIHGANVNMLDKANRMPLIYAIEKNEGSNCVEIIKLLLTFKTDVNVLDKNKKTPLIYAVEKNSLEIVKLLIDYGAIPTKVGGDGKSPIDIAYSKGYFEILNLLIEAESKMLN